mmetsp:Transcript_92838/g.170668  ORF Transcript_92838/g.170668 Transcript_92838/m.170668 type:complete len:108 (+) Transcript_92838:33-356(+)
MTNVLEEASVCSSLQSAPSAEEVKQAFQLNPCPPRTRGQERGEEATQMQPRRRTGSLRKPTLGTAKPPRAGSTTGDSGSAPTVSNRKWKCRPGRAAMNSRAQGVTRY